MKRRYYLGLAMLVLAILVVGCAPASAPAPAPAAPAPAPIPAAAPSPEEAAWAKVVAAAKAEGRVVAYTNEFVSDWGLAVERAFFQDTGIRLERMSIGSSARVERIKAEQRAGLYIADTSDGAAAFQMQLKADGLTQPMLLLPVFKQEGVWLYNTRAADRDGHVLTYSPSMTNPWVNTKLVKAEDFPQSWSDLLDPKWKGRKIGIAHPTTSSHAYTMYTGLTRKAGFKDDYFIKLGQQDPVFVVGTARDSSAGLARGDYPLALGSNVMGAPMVKRGAPIKPLDMKEGVISSGVGIALVKNAPHPNAAKVFVNWLLSKQGQEVFAGGRGLQSMRKDVPDFSPEEAKIVYKKVLESDADDVAYIAQVQREQILTKMWIKQ